MKTKLLTIMLVLLVCGNCCAAEMETQSLVIPTQRLTMMVYLPEGHVEYTEDQILDMPEESLTTLLSIVHTFQYASGKIAGRLLEKYDLVKYGTLVKPVEKGGVSEN